MIPNYKCSPKLTANDPQRKIGMACTQVSGWSCQFYYYYVYKTSDLKRNFTSQINTWIKTKWKKSLSVNMQHTTFTSCQNAACSNEFFLWRVDYTWRKTFWLSKCDFCRLFHTERSWHAFSAVIVVSGRHDLPFDARAFPLTSFEMQCSSLPLNKGFRLFNFLQSASWIRIIISDFLLVRECDGFLRCFVTR